MRLMIGVTCVALALVMVSSNGDTSAAQQDKPKYTIKEVMDKAAQRQNRFAQQGQVQNGHG